MNSFNIHILTRHEDNIAIIDIFSTVLHYNKLLLFLMFCSLSFDMQMSNTCILYINFITIHSTITDLQFLFHYNMTYHIYADLKK